jgi:hypothetical protein
MAHTRRVRRDVRPAAPQRWPRRLREPQVRPGSAWRRLVRDGRVYVAEPTGEGMRVTVLAGGEGGVRRELLDDGALELAAFLLTDATGRPPPAARAQAFADDVLAAMPPDRLVVTSLDLCCWAVVHAVLDEHAG